MRLRPAIEFGDACPKRGVFRNQSVDPRYQRDNQRVSLKDPNSLSQLAFTGRPSPILGPRLSICGVSGSDSALCVTAP